MNCFPTKSFFMFCWIAFLPAKKTTYDKYSTKWIYSGSEGETHPVLWKHTFLCFGCFADYGKLTILKKDGLGFRVQVMSTNIKRRFFLFISKVKGLGLMAPNNTVVIFTVVLPATLSNITFSFMYLANSYFIHIYIMWEGILVT